MTLGSSPIPLSSLHKNTSSPRFNSTVLNTFLQRFFSVYHNLSLVKVGAQGITVRSKQQGAEPTVQQ